MIRSAVAAGSLALVGALAGCGGSDDSEASAEDFCATFNDLFDNVLSADPSDTSATVKAFKDWAADMEDVGAPADMPDDARHGFELFIDQAKGIDDDATLESLQSLGEGLSEGDKADGEAFNDWATDNCPLDLPSPAAS